MRYPLYKARQILKQAVRVMNKRGSELTTVEKERTERMMQSLQDAILNKDRTQASAQATELQESLGRLFPRKPWMILWEMGIALVVALVVAIAIRQSCFEPMSIPTGSMRPTLKEQDLLIVSKTNFGVNVPLQAQHLYFDPDLIERSGIVIWSGHNIDLPDIDTSYFFLIPSKKAFVKRLIGKPGDTLYFYGGQIWGVDKDGHELTELRGTPAMHGLEHIPFQTFEGRSLSGGGQEILLRHFNKAIGKVSMTPKGVGQIYDGQRWIKDAPFDGRKERTAPRTLTDFFGIGNFGMARLVSLETLKNEGVPVPEGSAQLYLQIAHHPNLTTPAPRFMQGRSGEIYPYLTTEASLLPLQAEHVKALKNALYTSRFQVANQVAIAYGQQGPGVPLPGVPDGWYEYYYGKPVSIGFRGHPSELPVSHPLRNLTDQQTIALFNHGINFMTQALPLRYVYFRDGDLFVMGQKLMGKDDPSLVKLVTQEEQRARQPDYTPFVDSGPPVKDGKIDVDFIRAFGFQVPEKHYLLMGDNHAMSADSRFCGAVPQENIMGAPSWIVLPHDERSHLPQQPGYPWWTLPRAIVWSLLAAVALAWWIYSRWSVSRPVLEKPLTR